MPYPLSELANQITFLRHPCSKYPLEILRNVLLHHRSYNHFGCMFTLHTRRPRWLGIYKRRPNDRRAMTWSILYDGRCRLCGLEYLWLSSGDGCCKRACAMLMNWMGLQTIVHGTLCNFMGMGGFWVIACFMW